MYPPLAVNIPSIPPCMFVNHGTPATPNTRYKSILNTPYFLPSIVPAINAANVWNVINTGLQGTVIATCAIIPVKHANTNDSATIVAVLALFLQSYHEFCTS